ncbi:MAG: hypothetical protein K6B39_01020 [Lachnospiraceae bacterium]|nr:hypothetical protein [Lachnospiraceae bacterium]
MKKKAVVVVLAMIIGLCSTSCSRKGEQDVPVSKIAIDYLAVRNVVSSKVKKADFTFFSEYKATVEPIDYWSVSERLESATASFCDLKYSEKERVETGDAVTVRVYAEDTPGKGTFEEKKCVVVVGAELFNRNAEERMIGMRKGDTVKIALSDDGVGKRGASTNLSVSIDIIAIGKYEAGDDFEDSLRMNGFATFDDFYHYLYDVVKGEEAFLSFNKRKADFFEEAFSRCEFDLSEDDLKNFAVRISEEHEGVARDLGMNTETYYSSVLKSDRNGFFELCVDSAEYEIKSALVIGMLASEYEIDVSEGELDDFCKRNTYEIRSDADKTVAAFLCLQEKVLTRFGVVYQGLGN